MFAEPLVYYYRSDALLAACGNNETLATGRALDLAVTTRITDYETIAVVSGTGTPGGRDWEDSLIAARRGLIGTLGLGEVISSAMVAFVEGNPTRSGWRDLVRGLNNSVRAAYARIEYTPDFSNGQPVPFGSFAHAVFHRDTVTITTVGDCFVAVNGEVIAGATRSLDQIYQLLVSAAAKNTGKGPLETYNLLIPALRLEECRFLNYFYMEPGQVDEYRRWMIKRVANLLQLSIGQARQLIDPLFEEVKSIWFGGIDGNGTPGCAVHWMQRNLSQVEQLVMFSGGLRPSRSDQRVHGLNDLEATDPEHREQLAIIW